MRLAHGYEIELKVIGYYSHKFIIPLWMEIVCLFSRATFENKLFAVYGDPQGWRLLKLDPKFLSAVRTESR